ncbi:zinc/iron permease [Desulfuribacillus alkaliarsenatis]|uniref:Zinc/iron permease n=2 Tax=Desulfuribacillus alkaliarsenatis TaxID=766136 RepID=A0A1E5G4N3_9FIRM|nr:ZIP family metal transporter [Desulfuribacillus alkaliarsenatis]OEF98138.1 zinc/iron permease [Desulfuribacillus alkaliarsenatis]
MVLGAIVFMVLGSPGKRLMAGLLGFAGGIMLAISVFELMPEALELSSMTVTIVGFILGCGLLYLLDIYMPHAHMSTTDKLVVENEQRMPEKEESKEALLRTGYLIFFGIALHNVPEGLAIGAGVESSPELGMAIAIAIALHNIPEGLAVAGPLLAGGLSSLMVILFTFVAGMMTVVGTALGLLLFNISTVFIGGSLAFAAGAMFYIVNDELIPQANKMHAHIANLGLILGLLIGFVIF